MQKDQLDCRSISGWLLPNEPLKRQSSQAWLGPLPGRAWSCEYLPCTTQDESAKRQVPNVAIVLDSRHAPTPGEQRVKYWLHVLLPVRLFRPNTARPQTEPETSNRTGFGGTIRKTGLVKNRFQAKPVSSKTGFSQNRFSQ